MTVMRQRTQLKLFCAVVCVLIAMLCAFNRAPILAVLHGFAAFVVARIGFGRKVESAGMEAFVRRLRDASYDGETRDTMVLATVWPNVISAPIVPSPKRALTVMSIVFRDEFSASQWRTLSTRLRHQPRAALWPHAGG